jgi:hypothetical protein
MDSCTNFQTSAPCRSIRPLAGYRVMARHCDQNRSLVTLAQNSRAARILAKAFCDAIERNGHRNGIVSVQVEEWVGTLTEGQWERISLRYGGFFHWFTTHESRNGDHRNLALPRTGDEVQCVLLGEKTRKGGWKAKLLQRGLEGPITNTADVTKSATPGQAVTLRVGAISHDGKRIQFHWQEADNPEGR